MERKAQQQPVVITVAEALALLEGALSRASLYAALKRGEIPNRRVGRRILIPRARLLAWLTGDAPAEAPDGERR